MSIYNYIPEGFVTYSDRSDIDGNIYQLSISNKVQYSVDETIVGNRAFFSSILGESNNKISLSLTTGGELFDVIILTGGLYVKIKSTLDFTAIPSKFNDYIDGTIFHGYQGDCAIFILYFDKTSEELASAKKYYLYDNTNGWMGNGEPFVSPSILGSSANVLINETKSIMIMIGGIELGVPIEEVETYKYTQTNMYQPT